MGTLGSFRVKRHAQDALVRILHSILRTSPGLCGCLLPFLWEFSSLSVTR